MSEQSKLPLDLNLILPAALLILEVIAIIILVLTGYKITQFLLIFFILLGAFLVFQVGRQLFARWRIHQAVTKVKEGQMLADAGKNLRAVRLWKSLLFSLPEKGFFDVLQRIASAYKEEDMPEAVQQAHAIQAESRGFFEMTRNLRKATPKDRRNWKARALELQKMIKALPEKPGQDFTDTKPES